MGTNRETDYVAETISCLRAYGKTCEEREKIMRDHNFPHSAEIARAVADAVFFSCQCFEDALDSSSPKRQQACIRAIKEVADAQASDNADFSNNILRKWVSQIFG